MKELCAESLLSLCQLTIFFPQLTREEWLAFLLGTLIVVFFAMDHYKIPTYAKTTIGEFIEIAPEHLTSTSRYKKGLYIYIGLIFGLYLAFCFFWSQGLAAILSGFGIKIDKNELWPLAAATAVTLVGTAGDKNPLGRLEAAVRSIAHEAAYIPEAVLNLSSALSSSFEVTPALLAELGDNNAILLSQVGESQAGSLQTWIRAKYLYSRLELLRKDSDFHQLLNRADNIRAFDFLKEEAQTLGDRVAQRLQASHTDLDDALKKKVESYRDAVAMFLASVLWQGCGNEAIIFRKLSKVSLPVTAPDRSFSWGFLARVLASVAAGSVVSYICLYLTNWQLHGELTNYFWHLTLASLVCILAALFFTRRRENQLTQGKTSSAFDAALAMASICGLPIGFMAAVSTFAVHQGGQARFWGMLWTGLALAVLLGSLFEPLMRWAAQSSPLRGKGFTSPGPGSSANLGGTVAKAALLYGVSSFALAFLMFWIGQQLIVKGAPNEVVTAAKAALTKVIDGYTPKSPDDDNQVHSTFRAVPKDHFASLLQSIKDAQPAIGANDVQFSTIQNIKTECAKLNEDLQNLLFSQECEFNGNFTKELGDATWVENLRSALFQVQSLISNLEHLEKYRTFMSAMANDWPRAFLISGLWAATAVLFAISMLLYRRSVLWGVLDRKVVREYLSSVQTDPDDWLRSPIFDLNGMTPLEMIRYQDLRATLSDYLKTTPPPPRKAELRIVA